MKLIYLTSLLLLSACSANVVAPLIDNRVGDKESKTSSSSSPVNVFQPNTLPALLPALPSSTQSPATETTSGIPEAHPLQSLPPLPAQTATPSPPISAPSLPLSSLPTTSTSSEDTGSLSVGLSWDKPSFDLLANQNDIAYLELTVKGTEIAKRWGREITQRINIPGKRLRLNSLPPGFINVRLTAFDQSGNNIGVTEVSQILIQAGQVSSVNMLLQLIDTIVEETDESFGHLSIDVMIRDGKTITRKKTLAPQGGYLQFEAESTSCQQTQSAPPDIFLPSGQLPAINLPGTLPSIEIIGSSQKTPFVLQGDDLSGASNSNIPCSIMPTALPVRENTLEALNFSQAALSLIPGDKVDLTSLLQIKSTKASSLSALQWSTTNKGIARVSSTGELVALQAGESIVSVTVNDEQASLQVHVQNVPKINPPAFNFSTPSAQLELSQKHLKKGQLLRLNANNSQGSIFSYYWTLSGGLMAAQTLEPYTEMVFSQAGTYTASLTLLGTNGKQYLVDQQQIIVE